MSSVRLPNVPQSLKHGPLPTRSLEDSCQLFLFNYLPSLETPSVRMYYLLPLLVILSSSGKKTGCERSTILKFNEDTRFLFLVYLLYISEMVPIQKFLILFYTILSVYIHRSLCPFPESIAN